MNLWAGKWCIVICIVILNTILVVQRRIDRSSHRRFSIKKVFLQIFQNFQENTCARVFSLRGSITGFFPVNFPKFVGPLFFQNTFGRLLLHLKPCQISMTELYCGNSNSLTVFAKRLIIYVQEISNHALLAVSFSCIGNKISWNFVKSRCSYKYPKFQWKATALEFLFNKVESPISPVTLFKKDFNTGVFSWILWNI